eukprot:TRINITY_DN700_c1_g2_i1.p1 TRINITY_DN700_c1_g2~~TRINITY_DN700_c1_g2_i1.p1  ORF type:complete len:653 (-),score=93.05 TRINITY_DN700_c1_g2_i1:893-2851(-)
MYQTTALQQPKRGLGTQTQKALLPQNNIPASFKKLAQKPARQGCLSRVTQTGQNLEDQQTNVQQQDVLREFSAQDGLKVVVVGGGIGGLVLSVALLKKGVKVQVLERDVTAIRGEGKYRGPIQVQSNALAALEAIDADMAREIFQEGCITGDRINGLCDGVTGKWYVKFDTFHPAVSKGLPVTRVISRHTLQEVLTKYVLKLGGEKVVLNSSQVVGFEEEPNSKSVTAILSDGSSVSGDMLIGADGIWSKIRKQLVGPTEPNYSEYTCYTGIADYTPADINTVGYRVFLGNGQYFVSSDVGDGKMQWYGFHKEAAGGSDPEGCRKQRLLEIFQDWTYEVKDLINFTPEEDILRRDIYDRPPIYPWVKGRVALVGDSAHAMQPNLGQGGCMAIEDGYQLAKLIGDDLDKVDNDVSKLNIPWLLNRYQNSRVIRTSVIHGMAGMAAIMASTYKAYLGEGLGPLEWIEKYKIPHPGRVGGQAIMKLTMPQVLGWVLGGNVGNLKETDRLPYCLLDDQPRWGKKYSFDQFIGNDDDLLRAAEADWLLCTEQTQSRDDSQFIISEQGITVSLENPQNLQLQQGKNPGYENSLYFYKNGADYYVENYSSSSELVINELPVKSNTARIFPSDDIQIGEAKLSIKMQHVSVQPKVMAMAN